MLSVFRLYIVVDMVWEYYCGSVWLYMSFEIGNTLATPGSRCLGFGGATLYMYTCISTQV